MGQTRHFGRAALRCGVSQPALSEQIRKLEALLGTALFERGRRGVQVTATGIDLLLQIDRVLGEARGLLEIARGATLPLAPMLRMGVIQTLAPFYLPLLLQLTRAALPQLPLRLNEERSPLLLDGLRAGSLDVLVTTLTAGREGLCVDPLFFEPFVLVCPVEHPLARQQALHVPDLNGDTLILIEEGFELREQVLRLVKGAGPHLREANSVEMLWHMIAAGEGYSLVPALSLTGREATANLVAIRPLPDPAAGRTIVLAWRDTDPRGPALQQLAATLRTSLPHGVHPAITEPHRAANGTGLT